MEEIHEIVNELKNAKIVSIIGKVGTGKTTLATNIIKDFITDTEVKRNVAIYSFESFSVSFISLISQMKKKNLNVFMNKTDFDKNKEIEEETNTGFFYLYDGVGMPIDKVKSEINKLSEEIKKYGKKLDAIVVDYLQLTYPLNLPVDTNFEEVAEENIKKVKELAEHYNIPIILVTMLSNNDKKRDKQKEIIKENSDIVIELEKQENNSQIGITNLKNKAEIINCKFDKNSCEFIEVK